MTEKLITIGIPTYNGSKYIRFSIDSVIHQIVENKLDCVELIISDNDSNDNTAAIIHEYCTKYPEWISYYKNDKNIGFDANVNQVVKRAKANYVWLLSDDDVLLDGAVLKVLNVIQSTSNLSLIIVNYNNNMPLPIKQDLLCKTGDQFFENVVSKNGLVSCNVVCRAKWLELQMENDFGCLWIHFKFAIKALSPKLGNLSYIVLQNLVQIGGESRWGDNGSIFLIGFKYLEITKLMPGLGYRRRTKTKCDAAIKGGNFRSIPLAKIAGLSITPGLLARFIRYYYQYPSFWIIDFPLLLSPKIVLVFFRNVYLAYKKISVSKGVVVKS